MIISNIVNNIKIMKESKNKGKNQSKAKALTLDVVEDTKVSSKNEKTIDGQPKRTIG